MSLRRSGVVRAVVALTSAGLISPACRQAAGDPRIEAVYNKTSRRLELLKYDANGDGVPDTFSHMDGNKVGRIEIDTDGDGRIDRWEYYGADGKLDRVGFSSEGDGKEDAWSFADATGAIGRIEISTTRDGRVNRVEHYQHGTLVRAEEDTDADGTADRWETYESNRLIRVSFDPGHTGAATQALVYATDGSVHVE